MYFNRNRIFCLAMFFMAFASCINKRYAKFIHQKLDSSYARPVVINKDAEIAMIKSDSLVFPDTLMISRKRKSQFIPAIFYWQWNNTIDCQLNPSLPLNNFKQSFYTFFDSAGLRQKLTGRSLELSIDRIPNRFIYVHKGYAAVLLVAYITNELEAIFPEAKELKIRYRLLSGNTQIKTGVIIIQNKDQPVKNIWRSTKKFTWTYLDQYDTNCRDMYKEFFEKLLIEIE